MNHCRKIVGGRSPPVRTKLEWEEFHEQVELLTTDSSKLPFFTWLSATEGDTSGELGKLPFWPIQELVNGTELKLEAKERVWRDYYTGNRQDKWEQPYWVDLKDEKYGEAINCLIFFPDKPKDRSWGEWMCQSNFGACPCQYPIQPVLLLRGVCKDSFLAKANELIMFTPKQLPNDPDNLFFLGRYTARITYQDVSSQWILTDAKYNVTAVSWAPKVSYVIGKHEWTISNDTFECNKGMMYTTKLKLTGCNQDGEFTCNDGQCVKMEERCNQVPDCRDKSDETGCQLLVLETNYDKNIPPIRKAIDGGLVPVDVGISITLIKVVDIDEVGHSLHLQLQISLKWRENRATYQNLKNETSLNTLNDNNIKKIWLPLIIYQNTDQKESTRLGVEWEWKTRVMITREGNFIRSGADKVDEAEIFDGADNNLTMFQTYTHEFQCQYQLQAYPFDTQVRTFDAHVKYKCF